MMHHRGSKHKGGPPNKRKRKAQLKGKGGPPGRRSVRRRKRPRQKDDSSAWRNGPKTEPIGQAEARRRSEADRMQRKAEAKERLANALVSTQVRRMAELRAQAARDLENLLGGRSSI